MLSYLKRAREHKEFLLKETREFERGKRHLANMMGMESSELTQHDIDEAVKYLFPSGLFEKKARPLMKHPDIIYAAQKDAQFAADGRPYHYLFYTLKPVYHDSLNRIANSIRELNKHEDEQLAKGVIIPPGESKYSMAGKRWLDLEEMKRKFIEPINQVDYDFIVRSLESLCDHPYSNLSASHLDEYSVDLPGQSLNLDLPEIQRDEATGQIFTELIERRREHVLKVKVVLNGSGIINIEGRDILFFDPPYLRSNILSPLQISGMIDKVDIHASFVRIPIHLGQGAISGAIRYAVARSIAAYTDKATQERLRLAGLLTRDNRLAERKKVNQQGARRKYTWKKR